MGKEWDGWESPAAFQRWCAAWAAECLRVLKPGGYLLAFGGSRTGHRLTSGIEDAGFEIRDGIAWLYGSGFPKSQNVGKAIDKAAGAKRTEKLGPKPGHEALVGGDNLRSLRESGALSGEGGFSRPWMSDPEAVERAHWDYAPVTPEAALWEGWGTALKPAQEPIVVARKPLGEKTVTRNVLRYGTGALNIADTRVEGTGDAAGRWPANVVLSHTEWCAEECQEGCPVLTLDAQSGTLKSGKAAPGGHVRSAISEEGIYGGGKGLWQEPGSAGVLYGDQGGASRFFPTFRYQAKAPGKERPEANGVKHPTVKPLALIRWLVRLVTPPGGTVLDPFAGSGTTGEAAFLEGFNSILIESKPEYIPLIHKRMAKHTQPAPTEGHTPAKEAS